MGNRLVLISLLSISIIFTLYGCSKPPAPHSELAGTKLVEAMKKLELPASLDGVPKSEDVKRYVVYIRRVYSTAGFDFDKSLIQLNSDLEKDPDYLSKQQPTATSINILITNFTQLDDMFAKTQITPEDYLTKPGAQAFLNLKSSIYKFLQLPVKFVVAAIKPQGDGGERTRILIRGDVVNPGTGAGFRYDLISIMSSPFSGSFQASYWFAGAVHLYEGKVSLPGVTFEGDPKYPLTFLMTKNNGLVFLCGRGTVTLKDGNVTNLGQKDSPTTWLPRLKSRDPVCRGAAAQALGFLTQSKEDKDMAIPALIALLDDKDIQVRRNSAEALGRLADKRSLDPLTKRAEEKFEKDEWVRKVAAESVQKITK